MTAHDDFWERVDKTGPCWLWLGHIDSKGYGRITTWRNGTIFAHRLAYELTNGPIPVGLQIDHLCRIRSDGRRVCIACRRARDRRRDRRRVAA